MNHIMAKFWWIIGARGLLGVLLGLVSLGWILSLEGSSSDVFGMSIFAKWASVAATLILVLGLYAFLDGLFAVILGFQDYGDGRHWKSLIVEGFLSIGLGVLTWVRPEITALILLYWIAAWAIATGLLEIAQGNGLNEYRDRRKPLFFAGLCSVLFGVLILVFRVKGVELIWVMGIYAFAFGIPLLVLSARLRKFAKAR